MAFIDDHSRNTWPYLLKEKDRVFKKFKEFISKVEIVTDIRTNNLRSEKGGEYTSKEMISYYKEAEIERELIVPYYLE